MEWFVAIIVLLLLFGKNITASLSSGFTNYNAVPTPDGLPATTIQNNDNPPTAQPSPWTPGNGACASNAQPVTATPVLGTIKLYNPITRR